MEPPKHGREAGTIGDEIHLRDLYLIFRNGLPWILAVGLVVGVAAFLVMALRPPAYESHAVVTMGATPVTLRQESVLVMDPDAQPFAPVLVFVPPDAFTFDEYRAIATARSVLDDVLATLHAEREISVSVKEFLAAIDLVQASKSAVATQNSPLTVEHRVAWNDPAIATELANAWAQASVRHIRTSLLAGIEPVLETTRSAAAARRAELDALEDAWVELEPEAGDTVSSSREGVELQRELTRARRAYYNLADLESAAAYIAQLTPDRVRILEPAVVPVEPASTSPLIVGALAAVLGGIMATIFVFLREAVRDPTHPDLSRRDGTPAGVRTHS